MVILSPAMAQQTIRINRPYILIDVTSKDNVNIGEISKLYRWINQVPVITGTIKALVFKDQFCAFKILNEHSKYPIALGDWLLGPDAEMPQAMAGPLKSNIKIDQSMNTSIINRYSRQKWVTWTTATAAAVCGGFAYYYWDQAEDASDAILQTLSEERYNILADEIRQYDNKSNLSQWLSGGFLVLGAVHYFITRNQYDINVGPFALSPAVSPHYPGVGIKLALK